MARVALGLSTEGLAHDAHLAPSTVRKFERCRGIPTSSVRVMVAIERALTARGAIFQDVRQIDGSTLRTVSFRDPLPPPPRRTATEQFTLI